MQQRHITGRHDRLKYTKFSAGGLLLDDTSLIWRGRIAEVDAHQKSVELILGKEVCAFELIWILCGDHHEGAGQFMCRAVHRHRVFGHRFEQGRLCPRCRAVDLVGDDDVVKDRPWLESKGAVLSLVDGDAGDIARKQVRCALDAGHRAAHAPGQCSCKHGLAHARHILDEEMPPCQQAGNYPINRRCVTEEDGGDILTELVYDLSVHGRATSISPATLPSHCSPEHL